MATASGEMPGMECSTRTVTRYHRPGPEASRLLGALTLLVAGSLKAYDALTNVYSVDAGLPAWFRITIVEFEWGFGLWLLAGLHPRATRRLAMACFATFAAVALFKSIQGDSSCGCFGTIRVAPWATLLLDLGILSLFARSAVPSGVSFADDPVQSRSCRGTAHRPGLGRNPLGNRDG